MGSRCETDGGAKKLKCECAAAPRAVTLRRYLELAVGAECGQAKPSTQNQVLTQALDVLHIIVLEEPYIRVRIAIVWTVHGTVFLSGLLCLQKSPAANKHDDVSGARSVWDMTGDHPIL